MSRSVMYSNGRGIGGRLFDYVLQALVSAAILLVMAVPSSAQIVFEGSGTPGITAVCGFQNQLIITTNDSCADPVDPSAAPTTIRIGPAPLVVNGIATFNSNVSVNALLQANTVAATLGGFSTVDVNNALNVASGATVNMGNNRVTNVATPTAGTDAANKQYVDDQNATQQTQINSNTNRITSAEAVNTSQQTQINNNTSVNAAQQVQIDQNTTDITMLQGLASQANDAIAKLRNRDDELAEGIAISLALDAPQLRNGQVFAMRGGWGNFDGSNAAGVTAAGLVGQNVFGQGDSVIIDAGIGFGTGNGTVAGKAGVTIGW